MWSVWLRNANHISDIKNVNQYLIQMIKLANYAGSLTPIPVFTIPLKCVCGHHRFYIRNVKSAVMKAPRKKVSEYLKCLISSHRQIYIFQMKTTPGRFFYGTFF